MSKKIKYEGKTHIFPDNATDEEIQSALEDAISGGPLGVSPISESGLKRVTRPPQSEGHLGPELNALRDAGYDDKPTNAGAMIGGIAGAALGPGGLIPSMLYSGGGAIVGKTLEDTFQGRAPSLDTLKAGGEQALLEGSGQVVGSALRGVTRPASNWYRKAIAPGVQDIKKLPQITRTGLDALDVSAGPIKRTVSRLLGQEPHGLSTTKHGLESSERYLEGIKSQVNKLIADAEASGKTLDTRDVMKRLDELKEFFGSSVHGEPFLDAIKKVERGFFKEHTPPDTTVWEAGKEIPSQTRSIGPVSTDPNKALFGRETIEMKPTRRSPGKVGIARAQKIKQTEGRLQREQYGELSSPEKEARKQLTRGIKEEIENIIPEIKGLNAQESKMIDLEGSIERIVQTKGLKQVGGHEFARGAGEVAEGQNPAYWIGTAGMKRLFANPEIRSKIAIALDMWRKRTGPASLVNMPNVFRVGKSVSDSINQPDSSESVQLNP